jgi:hypothetical protein
MYLIENNISPQLHLSKISLEILKEILSEIDFDSINFKKDFTFSYLQIFSLTDPKQF